MTHVLTTYFHLKVKLKGTSIQRGQKLHYANMWTSRDELKRVNFCFQMEKYLCLKPLRVLKGKNRDLKF